VGILKLFGDSRSDWRCKETFLNILKELEISSNTFKISFVLSHIFKILKIYFNHLIDNINFTLKLFLDIDF